jgi:very-short-patch-repair endonuclease
MQTFRDYLVWYNNLDVEPFVERDKDLYYSFKNNIVGGPQIIFQRYHERDKTFIRGGKPCKRVWGADANALYLWALAQDMPCGYYARRSSETNFRKQDFFNKSSIEWLDYVAQRDGVNIEHAHNMGEKRIGRYFVDGFDTANKTIYEFNGCYFHGHQCEINEKDYNERCGVPMRVLYERTIERKRYLQDRGYTVVDIWECLYKQMRKTDDDLKLFRQNYKQGLDVKTAMSEAEILSMIKSGKIFGVVECDIHVPDDIKK